MPTRYSRDHVQVRLIGDTAILSPSAFLLRQLGQPVRLVTKAPGASVKAAEAAGRLEGTKQSCHLYAPFDLSIIANRAGEPAVEVKKEGEPKDELLDDQAYAAHVATLPR